MRKNRIAKRMMAYIAAAAIMVSVGFMGIGFDSNAESQYIVADKATVRSTPSTAPGTDKDYVFSGAKVEVIDSQTGEDGKKWNKISYEKDGTTRDGWVRADLMTYDAPSGTTTEPSTPDTTQQPDTQAPADTQQPETQEPADTQNPTDTQVPEVDFTMPDAEISGNGYAANEDGSFTVMGVAMTIGEFADTQIPTGFSRADITYNSAVVKGLKCQFADVYLVYLTDGTNPGEFFVLDTQLNIVHSYVTLFSGSQQLILLVPPADAQVASCYAKTIYATDENTAVTAYQFNQSLDTTNATTVVAEYYYVYGVTKNGVPGWFLYDDVEKSYIRATTDLSVELEADEPAAPTPVVQPDDSIEEMIVVVMGAICLIFIILTFVFGIRSFRARKGLAKEEEEVEEEEELNFIQRRKQERKYRQFMENFEEEGDEAWEHLLPESERIPKVDKIVSQVDETGWQKEEYDVAVTEKEDYDLTDENTEADEKEFDKIEDILLSGLEESVNEMDKESYELGKELKEPEKDSKDLEFLDI